MWHWSPRRLSRKTIFFYQMCLAVAIVHTFFFSSFLYYLSGNNRLGDVFIHTQLLRNNIDFVVLPYAKHVSQRTLKKALKRKMHTPKKVVKKPVKKKPVQKPKIVQKLKKVEPKVVAETKKPVAKPEPKLAEKPLEKKVAKPEQALAQKKTETKPETKNVETEPVYVGKNDMEAMLIHDEIATALQEFWSPPAGLVPSQSCKISVVLDAKGNMTAMDIVQSSKILAYDMAARMALMKTEFPKKAWNNEFSLNF